MRGNRGSEGQTHLAVAVCLLTSALALAVAPLFVPDGYSWVAHTTSESAAQNVRGAWVARLGFVLFGAGALATAALRRPDWNRVATVFHAGFGLAMFATAAFPTRSWDSTVPFDPLADTLHSVAATVVGFCFAFGVVALIVNRLRADRRTRRLDVFAIAAAVVLPLLLSTFEGYAGLLQRVMFAVAYGWYLREVASGRDT